MGKKTNFPKLTQKQNAWDVSILLMKDLEIKQTWIAFKTKNRQKKRQEPQRLTGNSSCVRSGTAKYENDFLEENYWGRNFNKKWKYKNQKNLAFQLASNDQNPREGNKKITKEYKS